MPGDRCCETLAETQDKLAHACETIRSFAFGGLENLVAARWQCLSRVSTKLGLPVLVHGFVKHALKSTLLTPAELSRVRRNVQKGVAADAAAEDARTAAAAAGLPAPPQNVDHNDTAEAWRILTGKRTLSTNNFMTDPRTPLRFFGILASAIALDVMFASMADAEAWASDRVGVPGAPHVGLLQSLVADDGLTAWVHRQLGQLLLASDSVFLFLTDMCDRLNACPKKCCRELRGQQLRLSASFFRRFVSMLKRKPWEFIRWLDITTAEQLIQVASLFNVDSAKCKRCLSEPVLRIFAMLNEDPPLSDEEKRHLIIEVLESLSEDPCVFSMAPVEKNMLMQRQLLHGPCTRGRTGLQQYSHPKAMLVGGNCTGNDWARSSWCYRRFGRLSNVTSRLQMVAQWDGDCIETRVATTCLSRRNCRSAGLLARLLVFSFIIVILCQTYIRSGVTPKIWTRRST